MKQLHQALNTLEDTFRTQGRSVSCGLWAQLDRLRLQAIADEASAP